LLNQSAEITRKVLENGAGHPIEIMKTLVLHDLPLIEYPENKVFLKRIETICKSEKYKSRYIGNNNGQPMIIMAFLPSKNIDNVSTILEKLLVKNNVIPDYIIVKINSKLRSCRCRAHIDANFVYQFLIDILLENRFSR
jgi:hypothetical protein